VKANAKLFTQELRTSPAFFESGLCRVAVWQARAVQSGQLPGGLLGILLPDGELEEEEGEFIG
jgi:hypothetical protein